MIKERHGVKNRLLMAMGDEDFARVYDKLEFVDMPKRFGLSKANEEPRYSYFMETGIGSIVAVSPEGLRTEVGLFGRDGMTPTALMLDAGSSPCEIFVQVAGDGYRILSSILKPMLEASSALTNLFMRYAHTLAIQAKFTALSNAVHSVDKRLARWILMCHDRTQEDHIALTHEFLGIMLSVRRPSVTASLHVLEGHRFIISERGLITVRDRQGLEAFARDAYGAPEREYNRLIGPLR